MALPRCGKMITHPRSPSAESRNLTMRWPGPGNGLLCPWVIIIIVTLIVNVVIYHHHHHYYYYITSQIQFNSLQFSGTIQVSCLILSLSDK
jgi:hypothetical protein